MNFTKIKQVISTNVLSGVVTRYMADHYTKKFFFEKHLDFLLIFQLTCKESLSDAVQFVQDNKRVKDFVPEISVSQVSRANMNRDYTMFAEIFYYLVDRALSSKKLNLSNEEKEYIKNIKILDSTLIRLCLKYFDWAEYRKNVGAIKIHTLMDLESLCSEKIFMTSGKPHDSQLMNTIGFELNHTYLFDRGYINYKVFDSMCDNDIYFITRLKKNAAMTILEEYKLPKGDHNILSDCKVIIGQENGNTKMTNPLRLIIAASDDEEYICILTNRFDLTVTEIANLYRYRWQIEEFFKWIKQHLKIKKFFGYSENAVLIQILTALIMYVILLILQDELSFQGTLLELTRIFKNNLLEEFDEKVFRRYDTS
jgi:hypothetical protein